jgi:hypothetical protein
MSKNNFWHMRDLQPKRKFRWIATIGNGEVLYKYVIQKVQKPEWTTANKEHKILGHTFNFPGPVTWNTVDVNIIDLAGEANDPTKGNAALFLQNAIFAAGYNFPSSIGDSTLGITKAKAATSLGGLKVEQLDAAGKILEVYSFHNSFIEKVNFGGDFDYGVDDFVDVTLTIRYDWASIKQGNMNTKETLTTKTSERAAKTGLSGHGGLDVGSRPKNSKGGTAL